MLALSLDKEMDKVLKQGLQVLIVTQGFLPLHIDQFFNRPQKKQKNKKKTKPLL